MNKHRPAYTIAVVGLALFMAAFAQTPGVANPFATGVLAALGPFGASPGDEPASVLGMPATDFYDPLGGWSGGSPVRRVKLVEAAYNLDPSQMHKLITTLNDGSFIIVRFDQPITNEPAHPYGIDLLVFGNSFFTPGGSVNDTTDMNTLLLAGGGFIEPTKVSVSPGFTGKPGQDPANWQTWEWYRYDNGPYADTAFPTHAYRWDRTNAVWRNELKDFTKPVNPALGPMLEDGGSIGLSAADAIDLYDGSGGGTGFDLAESGFAAIQYVRVEGLSGFDGGEIDAFAAVRPMLLGDCLTIAPANLTNETATLHFQQRGNPGINAVTLHFTVASDVARVSTAPLSDIPVLLPCGRVLNGAGFVLSPVLGNTPVIFTADVRLACGPDYSGTGEDIVVLRQADTDWEDVPSIFDGATQSVAVSGVTNASTFALLQVQPPHISITFGEDGFGGPLAQVQFAAVPGWTYTLEHSQDFVRWKDVANQTPLVAGWTTLNHGSSGEHAFYRLRMTRR